MRALLALALIACDGGSAADAGRDGALFDAGLPPPPIAEPGRHDVEVIETRRIVPSEGLGVDVQRSNNNLDVIRHDGRVFLAWRTAPDHFAGTETEIHVVSSTDELAWEREATFAIDTDLREPRFAVIGGSLFLYLSVLGSDPLAFEPMGVRVSERVDGAWSELEDIGLPGYIAWRTRTLGGTPYMLAYLGGEHIYRFDGLPLSVDFLTSADGREWTPVDPARRTVYMGGGSESDFALGDDGTLYAIIRNEAGDENGWGSMVCRAPPGDIASWSCRIDPKKYDSPLMFWHDGEAYLVGRRNVTATGHYDLMRPGSMSGRTAANQLAYSSAPKRCALWRYVPGEDRIAYLLDLPSGGDTCFPAMIETATPGELAIYDYSSDLEDPATPRLEWREGQAGSTYIYRHVLRFTRR